MFTLSVIKPPKVDSYERSTAADYQKNWDLGLVYQKELRASMKNLAFAMRRDEQAHQHNLLRWMICGSIPNDISDACIGAMNSLMFEQAAAADRRKECFGSIIQGLL